MIIISYRTALIRQSKTQHIHTMNKPLVTLFIILMMFPSLLSATDNTITIQATGEVNVTADMILFNVNITQFNTDAREAFAEHKRQEAYLTSLLIEEGIDERYISANPVNISSVRRGNSVSGFETRQQVQIVLLDVTQFELMQVSMIEHGFGAFTGNFTSSKSDTAQKKALKKAVDEARNKAILLADAAGLKITGVKSIQYGSTDGFTPRLRGVSMAMELDSSGSLLQFERTIPVRESITIIFGTESL
ncbi:MAG: DUF541 domain-containing protein [Balneolaceae bacterium]|nr:MAG: DUF541 domain-containing protein [Balneolaceae bacterium]